MFSFLEKYGGWSDWSSWVCKEACRPGVEAVKTRACDDPPPMEGYTCPGESREAQPCKGMCRKSKSVIIYCNLQWIANVMLTYVGCYLQ